MACMYTDIVLFFSFFSSEEHEEKKNSFFPHHSPLVLDPTEILLSRCIRAAED